MADPSPQQSEGAVTHDEAEEIARGLVEHGFFGASLRLANYIAQQRAREQKDAEAIAELIAELRAELARHPRSLLREAVVVQPRPGAPCLAGVATLQALREPCTRRCEAGRNGRCWKCGHPMPAPTIPEGSFAEEKKT